MKNLSVAICLLTIFRTDARIPPGFKTCNRHRSDFKECIPKAVEAAVRQLKEPIKRFGLPSLEPLRIVNISIVSGNRLFSLEKNFTHLDIFGLTTVEVKKFGVDFDTNTVAMECFFPVLKCEAEFSANGTIMTLPAVGKGFGTAVIEKVTYNLTFKLEEYVKRSKKFYRVADGKLSLDAKHFRVKLENLYEGDKMMAVQANRVINDNWDILLDEGKDGYEILLGRYFSALFDNVLSRAPISELFGSL